MKTFIQKFFRGRDILSLSRPEHDMPIDNKNSSHPNFIDAKEKDIDNKQKESGEIKAKNAIEAERKRLAEIDEIAILYDAETVYQAKYGENPCTAAEMAFAAAKKSSKEGTSFIKVLMDDYKSSGAASVSATFAQEDGERKATAQEHTAFGSDFAKTAQKTK